MEMLKQYAFIGILAVIAFTACDNGNITSHIQSAHEHEWGEWDQPTPPSYIMADEETRICLHDPSHIETRTGTPALPITTTSEWNTALTQLDGKVGNYTITISSNIGVDGTITDSFGTTLIGSAWWCVCAWNLHHEWR